MRIKIGDQWFDSNDQPIMVELTGEDKDNIAHMSAKATRYCSYPCHLDSNVIDRWMTNDKIPGKMVR